MSLIRNAVSSKWGLRVTNEIYCATIPGFSQIDKESSLTNYLPRARHAVKDIQNRFAPAVLVLSCCSRNVNISVSELQSNLTNEGCLQSRLVAIDPRMNTYVPEERGCATHRSIEIVYIRQHRTSVRPLAQNFWHRINVTSLHTVSA